MADINNKDLRDKKGQPLCKTAISAERPSAAGHAEEVNRVLYAISDAVNATQDLDDLYQTIHQILGTVIDVANFFIAIVDLDMLMEPGWNGRRTYEEIVKIQPQQKAILASGYSEGEDVRACLTLGVGRFLKKPYSLEQLCIAVHEELGS